MDKKNTIIGVSLLVIGTVYMFKTAPQRQPQPLEGESPAPIEAPADDSAPAIGDPSSLPEPASMPVVNGHAQIEAEESSYDEVLATLDNDFVQVRFTNYGGAIKEIELKGFEKELGSEERYVMNHLRYAPALNLTTGFGDLRGVAFQSVPTSEADTIRFKTTLNDQLEIVRTYRISQESEEAAPFTISHQLELRNLTDQVLPLGEILLNIGTVAPSGPQDRFNQTFGYSNGEDVEFTGQNVFLGGGFLFFKKSPKDLEQVSDNIEWASLKNQFFITLLTPEEPATGYLARPVDFPSDETDGQPKTGMTADVKLSSITLPPAGVATKNFDFYAGPKEHGRLARLDKDQEKAMQFGFFGFISKILLMIMNGLYSVVGNWGVAIILLTVVVRGTLLPITLMSMKSMRKMSKLQEPMKALKERFPDNPQKQQQMMMELYRLNRINPVAGCLPMILQIPIFFALFYMLRSAAELRFADFLWISDLSKPDTVANLDFLGGFPLNALPFVWLATLAYQMWTMPTPSVDNAQAKLFKFMPFIFFPFTYTFSSGLVLYWTISNVFTIGQQWLAKRGDDTFEVQLPPALKKALEGDDSKKRRRKK